MLLNMNLKKFSVPSARVWPERRKPINILKLFFHLRPVKHHLNDLHEHKTHFGPPAYPW